MIPERRARGGVELHQVPTVIAGEGFARVGHERGLVRPDELAMLDEAVKRIALDVVLGGREGRQELGQRGHIGRANVTLIRARVHRDAVRAGLQREPRTGTVKDSVLADCFEALVGAIFLDGGYAAARKAVLQAFGPLLDSLDPSNVQKDPKTRLQELLHARGKPVPQYQVVATHGAPHERSFEVECIIEGLTTRGEGTSLQRAEQEAAKMMLDKLSG